jgi:hypothetical protein
MRSLINWDDLLTRAGTLLFPAEQAASHAITQRNTLRAGQSAAIARYHPSAQ